MRQKLYEYTLSANSISFPSDYFSERERPRSLLRVDSDIWLWERGMCKPLCPEECRSFEEDLKNGILAIAKPKVICVRKVIPLTFFDEMITTYIGIDNNWYERDQQSGWFI